MRILVFIRTNLEDLRGDIGAHPRNLWYLERPRCYDDVFCPKCSGIRFQQEPASILFLVEGLYSYTCPYLQLEFSNISPEIGDNFVSWHVAIGFTSITRKTGELNG